VGKFLSDYVAKILGANKITAMSISNHNVSSCNNGNFEGSNILSDVGSTSDASLRPSGQGIRAFLWKLRVYYHIQRSPSPLRILAK
jgi:hypothetical protein